MNLEHMDMHHTVTPHTQAEPTRMNIQQAKKGHVAIHNREKGLVKVLCSQVNEGRRRRC